MPVNVQHVTIVGGAISVASGSGTYYVTPEGGVTGDTLDTITGHTDDGVYELHVETAGQYWTITHNPVVTNGIRLEYGLGFVMTNPDDYIVLRGTPKGNYVCEFWRKSIPAT